MSNKKSEKLIENYITHKVINSINDTKETKQETMRKAGYSEISVKSNNPEVSKLYAEITTELVSKTGFSLREYVSAIEGDIANGLHLKQDLGSKIKQAKTLLDIYKGLAPTFKERTTTKDADGTLKTVWKQLN